MGPEVFAFLADLGIPRLNPVGPTPASGEGEGEARLAQLLEMGDPVPPSRGGVAEDPSTVNALFAAHGEAACFPLTPDGHLAGHVPTPFDADAAAELVVRLVEADMPADVREEALATTWLSLGYHDHDHPADLGGLIRGSDGRPRCCYVDVKLTAAAPTGSQRAKLQERARERKLGQMAQTVTRAHLGYGAYPGRGQPGLCVTLLLNPVRVGRRQAGFAVNWFFGIAANYQARDARWGWGGPRGASCAVTSERTDNRQK